MKIKQAFLALAIATVFSPAIASPANDEAQIRALEDRFAAAVSAKDLDGIMKTYSADVFVFDVVPPRQYVGAEAYRKDWKGVLDGYQTMTFTVSDLAVTSDGKIAYGHSIQRAVGKDSKGQPSDMTIRVTDVYRKGAGGWRIVQEHVSMPVDLATMKPDPHSTP